MRAFFATLMSASVFVWSFAVSATVSDSDGVSDATEARLQNISTRGLVQTGDGVMIGGFIIAGETDKTVLIRARGPSLADFGVAGVLEDPYISLSRLTGEYIDSNDNWASHSRASEIAVQLQPTNPYEAAIVATLAPGAYTPIVSGVSGGTGVGIVEVFELDTQSRLENISTRGFVSTGDDVMIGGFIIDGDTSKRVVIRGRGPSLADFGVQGALMNPNLTLIGLSGEYIDSNDDYATHAESASLPVQFIPTNAAESVIMATLEPGAYTAILNGVGNAEGVGIVEVFELDNDGGDESESGNNPGKNTVVLPPPPPPPTSSNRELAFLSLVGMRTSTRAAVAGNPREGNMLACTVQLRYGNECSLLTLPLIGMEFTEPSVDDIMTRVLVSHDWMAKNFRLVLETMPREIRLMTRALSAIVISYDIRPSFYWGLTGAIYLDPDGLWLAQEEQATVDTAPDFRADFGAELSFVMPWRYVRNNEYVTLTPTSGIRTVEDIRYRMAALLLHELAHANDFLSPARVVAADPSRTVLDIAIGGVIPSSQLSNVSPLRSQMMLGLGQVSFQGETASELQKSLVPQDIASEFSTDAASDYYNYSTTREDFAMLFEEAMMLYLFGIDRDVGVTNKPESGAPCADYIVEWGVRNRVLDQQVRDRAVRAIGDALPEAQAAVEQHLMGEDPPTSMVAGQDWCSNRYLDPVEASTPRRGNPAGDERRALGDTVETISPWL